MTKKDLALVLGLTPEAVYRWVECPTYAYAYILRLEDIKEMKEQVKIFAERL